jgi:hypothetical protein
MIGRFHEAALDGSEAVRGHAQAANSDQSGADQARRGACRKHAEQGRGCHHALRRVDGLLVYIHVIWFAAWIGFQVEKYPFGLLTMIVSLEAIFLSTFVMISQNRADSKREVIANEQWTTVQEEDRQNRQLLNISNQILDLTKAVNAYASASAGRHDRRRPTQPGRPRRSWRGRVHDWRLESVTPMPGLVLTVGTRWHIN